MGLVSGCPAVVGQYLIPVVASSVNSLVDSVGGELVPKFMGELK